MQCKERRHKRAAVGRASEMQQQQEHQDGVQRVKEEAHVMMRAGVQAKEAAVQHVRHPGKGMPIAEISGRERPKDSS